MHGRVTRRKVDIWRIALPSLLAAAVFIVITFDMLFPHQTNQTTSLWLATGAPLAALLRRPNREWPLLVAASVIGTMAGSLYSLQGSWLLAVSMAGNNALEYCLCAFVVRRRCGPYFDLTDTRHLAWLVAISSVCSLIRLVGNFTVTYAISHHGWLSPAEIITWAPAVVFGAFVLTLPLLAITSRGAVAEARPDGWALLLLAVLAGEVVLVFGPVAFPVAFIVMPVMMLLGWRYGLLGAGVGALVTILIAAPLSAADYGIIALLRVAGYGAQHRGSYLEFYFIIAILSGLPLAIIRAREHATAKVLAAALAAAELRAVQLAASERAAHQARARLSVIIETSSDVICTLDKEGRFLEVSENCATLWGWPRGELLGRAAFDFIPPAELEHARNCFAQRILGQPSISPQTGFIRRDGRQLAMSWSITWIATDQVAHCIVRDMTEHNELQAQAQHAQRLDSLGRLTGGVAHDFNNLLTVVIGNSEVLAANLSNPQYRELAELIMQAAERGADLIQQLLAFARRHPLEPRAFDLNAALDRSAPLIQRALGGGLDFSIVKASGAAGVFADPAQTEAALLNLCLNARDAMPNGGKLTIAIGAMTLKARDIQPGSEAVAGDYVAIRVSDTGTGIAPEVLGRIFEPFFTTKADGHGSGLGLSMVYGFVKQSRGFLEVATEPGKGTSFTLHLPATGAQEGETGVPASIQRPAEAQTAAILLVEDNDLLRAHARAQLQGLGYHVEVASSGAEALAVLERQAVDLLFTDVIMPGGMNGRELAERALARQPGLRVLFTSGYSRDTLTEDGRLIDGVTLLSKPYTRTALSEKVLEVLEVLEA